MKDTYKTTTDENDQHIRQSTLSTATIHWTRMREYQQLSLDLGCAVGGECGVDLWASSEPSRDMDEGEGLEDGPGPAETGVLSRCSSAGTLLPRAMSFLGTRGAELKALRKLYIERRSLRLCVV